MIKGNKDKKDGAQRTKFLHMYSMDSVEKIEDKGRKLNEE